ncbi:CPBP family intramembrane metalloprotease [Akkermansiaceae bacterium]|nr:CPBP family intramembrane metalloprotease [Akkermansiaceae bacterium]
MGTLIAVAFLAGSVRAAVRIYGLDQKIQWRPLTAVLMCLFALDWLAYFMGLNSEVVDPTDFFLVAHPDGIDLFDDIINSVVAAPIFEELMFRGVLFMGLMSRLGAKGAAVLSSVLFAVLHTQYDLYSLVLVGIFGCACCWLVWKTGSLKTGIVLHMIYNGLLTLDVYLFYQRPL